MNQDSGIHKYGPMLVDDYSIEDAISFKHVKCCDNVSGLMKYKCKFCNFRSYWLSQVQIHEVDIHTPKNENVIIEPDIGVMLNSEDKNGNDENTPMLLSKDLKSNYNFQCGHCDQLSTWKHVIKRHCEKLHNGDIKVIHVNKPKPKFKTIVQNFETDRQNNSSVNETARMTRVWVLQNDKILKMHKCPYCPQVSIYRTSIIRHMASHRKIEELPESRNKLIYSCEDCNYVSTNVGALATHVKVHYGILGLIICKYDSRRSDIEQIEAIRAELNNV